MPESASESGVNPYISSEEDEQNAGRLKPDVAYQVHHDIHQQTERWGLKINPDDSPIKKRLKYFVLSKVFGLFSRSTLPDYQAAQIVDLEGKAGRDPLTGLLNRRGFERQFNEALRELDQPVLFLMIDLDHFKQLNDEHGHAVGDQALKYLARALTDSVEIGDLVGRWGGEEFAIALKPKTGQTHSTEELFQAAEHIRLKVIKLLSQDTYRLHPDTEATELFRPIKLSLGVTVSQPDDSLETIWQRADKNLYKAKNGGRNQSFGDSGKIELLF